ncbi:MAG: hypothetical protein K2X27_12680 [Candidatus Obscuribacterales bacterium]|nr:hypothetical protein [Candidatus Obscuribacterales bacterium]
MEIKPSARIACISTTQQEQAQACQQEAKQLKKSSLLEKCDLLERFRKKLDENTEDEFSKAEFGSKSKNLTRTVVSGSH